MGVGVRLLIFILVIVVKYSGGQTTFWGDPPFISDANVDDNVVFQFYDPAIGQTLNMSEEIPVKFAIARINYNGTELPKIGKFSYGASELLGAEIEKQGDFYYIVVTKRQDYEQEQQRRYNFPVEITGFKAVTVYLHVHNIDDNPPFLYITPCEIPELETGLGKSECEFKVTDLDGALSTNNMKFFAWKRGTEESHSFFEIRRGDTVTEYEIWVYIDVIKPLDFYQSQVDIFDLYAQDVILNTTAPVIVKVVDMPNKDPEWRQVHPTRRYDEKTVEKFSVSAVDGDTGINKPIHYRFDCELDCEIDDQCCEKDPIYQYFSVVTETGEITVKEIDRDAEGKEMFPYRILAYKYDNESWYASFDGLIIIDDVNDQLPNFEEISYEISFEEEKYIDITLSIKCHDRDLGRNAEYTVSLKSDFPDWTKPFQLVPEFGYQEQEFKLVISDASLLDYDDENWQKIHIEIVSTEKYDLTRTNSTMITINLENWNDELPNCTKNTYETELQESAEIGTFVVQVDCHDRDINDFLTYNLNENAQSFLSINNKTGEIFVNRDDYFDYHRQNEIFVQVIVTDNLITGHDSIHTVIVQVIIRLLEDNNRTPQIQMPRSVISVLENKQVGFEIENAVIGGSDLDTVADLEFSIDWDNSFAIKPGKTVDRSDYEGCIEIVPKKGTDKRQITGQLVVREIKPGVTIDYEAFEILYVSIVLTDKNQTSGEKSIEALLPIAIEDENDNPPVWEEGTLTIDRAVREESEADLPIGTLRATDIDGPKYNVIRYRINPVEVRWKDWIQIDNNGQMTVKTSKLIDADTPKTDVLIYEVFATDCKEGQVPAENVCYETEKETIDITIIDTNNKYPNAMEDKFNRTIYIYENETTGFEVVKIISEDLDRDEPYSNITFTIDFRLQESNRGLFAVDPNSGIVRVELGDGMELDRDTEPDNYKIEITLTDNTEGVGVSDLRKNMNGTSITIVLLDVNDNSPELDPDLEFKAIEDAKAGTKLATIIAPDKDEPNTDNSRVQYNMTMEPIDPKWDDFEPFLRMDSPDNVSGEIYTTKALKGYWGSYELTITAFDLGIPQQSSTMKYPLTVEPYNYMKPKFIFPVKDEVIRLKREDTEFMGLNLPNGERLRNFEIKDDDGLEAGKADFELLDTVPGSTDASEYFNLVNIGDGKTCGLMLLKPVRDIVEFRLTLKAKDRGVHPGPLESEVNFVMRFIPLNEEPFFNITGNEISGNITEFTVDDNESILIPPAVNPRLEACENDECEVNHTVYYYIKDELSGKDFELKVLDEETIKLKPKSPLNRTESLTHTVRIVTSYLASMPQTSLNDAILTVNINVREFDPRPVFEKSLYAEAIAGRNIDMNQPIITVKATHSEELGITYAIKSIRVTDPSIDKHKSDIKLDGISGELKVTFTPDDSLKGTFVIDITATDTAEKVGETVANVYLLAADNTVKFTFNNTLEEINSKTTLIEELFTQFYGYRCKVHAKDPKTSRTRNDNDAQTDIVTYFIDEKTLMPVNASEIDERKNDVFFIERMQREFKENGLILGTISTDQGNTPENLEQMLKIILIIVATVLGVLLIVLLVTHCIKTRSLKRRLNALSTTKFGSQDSNLHRAGVGAPVAVPGTNKHAIEGSNPVFQNDFAVPQYDNESVGSGDSDLIGVDDDPQFSYDHDKVDKY